MKLTFGSILLTMIFPTLLQAQDWPGLGYYQEENKKIVCAGHNGNRVVFMGYSITEAWGHILPEFFAGKPYINRGIGGQTTPQMLIRFRADVIALEPSVVVVLGGTNDIAGNTGVSSLSMIEDNITSMAVLAKAAGITVILCSVLPAQDYPWSPGIEPAEKIATLNQWIKRYAMSDGCIHLDYYSPMANDKKGLKAAYSTDGMHPTRAGYEIMAPLCEKAIALALEK